MCIRVNIIEICMLTFFLFFFNLKRKNIEKKISIKILNKKKRFVRREF